MKDRESISIDISAASIFKVALIGILFFILYLLLDLILVLLTAVVIASSLEPATRWLGKYKIPRVPAVIIMYILIISMFVGVFYMFIPPVTTELSNFATSVPQYIDSINIFSADTDGGGQLRNAQGIVSGLSDTFSIEGAVSGVQKTISRISGSAFQAISTIFGGVFSLILVIIISFYLAVQEKGIENFLRVISPVKHEEYVIDLWKRSQEKIGKWMQGQLLLGLLIGILVYLGLTVLGVKYALILAILAAIAELIPIFGPIIAAVPAVLLGFLDSVTLGLMVIGLYLIIQQFENHLIYPLVVRKVVGVPPLIVILALIIGGSLAGFLGVLLSAPIAAAILEYTADIQREKHKLISEEKK